MNEIEKSAATAQEAIAAALKELNISRDEAEITVLDTGAKGFLGFGSRLAKVRVAKSFNPEKKATEFIRELSATIGLKVKIDSTLTDKKLDINLLGDDAAVFIGKRGQTLESLQYILNLVVNKGDAPYVGIVVDIENYRQRRRETLESLAHNLAKKVKLTNKNVVLEPMIPSERRIIHAALQRDKSIATKSEGQEPYRNVVIMPANVNRSHNNINTNPSFNNNYVKKVAQSKSI